MIRIDQLTAELCPDGVDYVELRSIGTWYGGGTPSKGVIDYWTNGNIPWLSPKDMVTPIVRTTQDYITEEAVRRSATKLVPATSVAVVVRSSILDRVLPSALIPVPIALNQDMKAVVPSDAVLAGFVAHLLRSAGQDILRETRKTGGSVASIEVPKLMSYKVPLPPLPIQHEIVRILDTFTELEAELEAELDARKRQYGHYRDELYKHDRSIASASIPTKRLSDVGVFTRGRRFVKTDIVNSGVPCIHYGEMYTHYRIKARTTKSYLSTATAAGLRKAQRGDVIIVAAGETVEDIGNGVAWLGEQDVVIHDACFAFKHSLDPTYVAHYLRTSAFRNQIKQHVSSSKISSISADGLGRALIPVPPMEVQQQIAGILDSFDALVSDLSVGLPAEIAARRKQYEYYRDRLLTFEEKS